MKARADPHNHLEGINPTNYGNNQVSGIIGLGMDGDFINLNRLDVEVPPYMANHQLVVENRGKHWVGRQGF